MKTVVNVENLGQLEYCESFWTGKKSLSVNGCAYAPFILTVDWLGWVCYLPDKLEFENYKIMNDYCSP